MSNTEPWVFHPVEMAGLSEEDVKRAKEAINVLSSLTSGNASSDSVADPSTSKPSTSGLGREGEGTVLDLHFKSPFSLMWEHVQ